MDVNGCPVSCCDNFDNQKGKCLIYDAERPDFCVNIGEIATGENMRPLHFVTAVIII